MINQHLNKQERAAPQKNLKRKLQDQRVMILEMPRRKRIRAHQRRSLRSETSSDFN